MTDDHLLTAFIETTHLHATEGTSAGINPLTVAHVLTMVALKIRLEAQDANSAINYMASIIAGLGDDT